MTTDQYIDKLEDLINDYREAIEKYKKLVKSLDREIEMHREYESTLREIICRLVAGRISEDKKQQLLEKFRN